MRIDRINLYISLFIITIGSLLLGYSFFVEFTLLNSEPGSTGPMFLPRYFLLVWIISGIAIMFSPAPDKYEQTDWHNLLYSASLILIFILLFEKIGYLISSTLFFLFHAYFAGYRKKFFLLICGILTNVIIFYIFTHILQLPLPEAPWQ
jgi:hypothetical protein